MKKLTVTLAVLIFSLVFASQTFAAGMLGANNGVGISSTTSTNGSILGVNRGVGVGTTGTTGVSGTGMLNPGVSNYGISPTPTTTPSTYSSYGTRTLSTPSTFVGTSSTNYNPNGTMRGYNYRTNATTRTTNNWGWMGLLGLLGLIGLRSNNNNRDREHTGGKH
ncbi:MAG: WGxxGxxG-CTERM domain-containing protein [Paenibacillaceae bacterium]